MTMTATEQETSNSLTFSLSLTAASYQPIEDLLSTSKDWRNNRWEIFVAAGSEGGSAETAFSAASGNAASLIVFVAMVGAASSLAGKRGMGFVCLFLIGALCAHVMAQAACDQTAVVLVSHPKGWSSVKSDQGRTLTFTYSNLMGDGRIGGAEECDDGTHPLPQFSSSRLWRVVCCVRVSCVHFWWIYIWWIYIWWKWLRAPCVCWLSTTHASSTTTHYLLSSIHHQARLSLCALTWRLPRYMYVQRYIYESASFNDMSIVGTPSSMYVWRCLCMYTCSKLMVLTPWSMCGSYSSANYSNFPEHIRQLVRNC